MGDLNWSSANELNPIQSASVTGFVMGPVTAIRDDGEFLAMAATHTFGQERPARNAPPK